MPTASCRAKRNEVEVILCRDERCEIEEIHPAHEVVEDAKEAAKVRGWVSDPLEKENFSSRGFYVNAADGNGRAVVRRTVAPWQRSSTTALDDAILATLSPHRAKIFTEIYRDVIDDYGNVTERTVYRRLAALVIEQKALYVKFAHKAKAIHVAALGERKVESLRRKNLRNELGMVYNGSCFLNELVLLDSLSRLTTFIAAEAQTTVEIAKMQHNYHHKSARGLSGYLAVGSKIADDAEYLKDQLATAIQSFVLGKDED